MTHDGDLAAFLPKSPPPRPDRREAAIDAAMRGFDGAGAPPPRNGAVPTKPTPWMRRNRPLVGAFASMALVASIGLPVWLASDFGPRARVVERPEPSPSPRADDAAIPRSMAKDPRAGLRPPTERVRDTDVGSSPPADQAERSPPPAAPVISDVDADARHTADTPLKAPDEDVVVTSSTVSPPAAPPPPPPPPPALAAPPPAAPAAPAPAAESRTTGGIIVTGSRVRSAPARNARDDLAQSQPTRSFRLARPVSNTCTVADPRRDIEACRSVFAATVPSDIRPTIADGVARAWRGDLKGAGAAFDRAIARSPRSAIAYYNRSLVFSRRGETRRAEADKERAALIDARYRDVAD